MEVVVTAMGAFLAICISISESLWLYSAAAAVYSLCSAVLVCYTPALMVLWKYCGGGLTFHYALFIFRVGEARHFKFDAQIDIT